MSERLAKNTLYLTIASVGQKIIAFVYFLLLARIMKPEQTGIYFLVTSFVTMFSVITDLGVVPVVIREVAKIPEKTKELIRLAFGTKLIFDCFAIGSVIFVSYLLSYNERISGLIIFTTVVMVVDSFSLLFYGILRGQQKLKYEAAGMFFGQLTTFGIGTMILFFHPSVFLLIVAVISGSVVNILISSTRVISQFGFGIFIPLFERRQCVWLLKLIAPFAIAGICTKIYSYIDTIIISKTLGSIALGIYSVAYKFTYAFQFFPLAFSAALYPTMSALAHKDNPELIRIFERSLWYIMILATPIVLGLWLIADHIISLTGSGYSESVSVLRVLIFVLFPIFLDFPIGSLLNASGHQTTKMKIMISTVLLSLVTNFTLIPFFGLQGAAIAAILNFGFMFFAELIFVIRVFPEFSLFNSSQIVGKILFSGIVMLIVGLLVKPFVNWILIIPISGVVYLSCLLIIKSVRKNDWDSIIRVFKRTPV